MSKRRKNGEGSWGERTINGIKYKYFKDPNGHFTYGKTTADINNKLDIKNEKEKHELGNLGVSNLTTFGEYITTWLKQKKTTSVEESTYDSYENSIHSLIINYTDYDLSGTYLHSLSDEIFQNYIDSLTTKYSLNSIKKVWGLIKECIIYAEIKKDIKPLHLKELVKTPSESNVAVKKREIEVPDLNDIELIYNECLRQCNNGKLYYGNAAKVVILIMYTGMRVSEIGGLKWSEVDIENRKLVVKESFAKVKNRDGESGTKYIHKSKSAKTKDSERIIPLPDRAIKELNYFLLYKTKDNDFCCVNNKTKQPYTRKQIEIALSRIMKNTECNKHFTPHGLRHGYGSILLNNGVDIKIVSELLGHSDVSFTYNVYIDIFKQNKENAINIFNKKEGE